MYFDRNKALKIYKKHSLCNKETFVYVWFMHQNLSWSTTNTIIYKLKSGGVLHETVTRQNPYMVDNCTMENNICVDDNTYVHRNGWHNYENFIASFKCAVLVHGIIDKNKNKSTV